MTMVSVEVVGATDAAAVSPTAGVGPPADGETDGAGVHAPAIPAIRSSIAMAIEPSLFIPAVASLLIL
jgi:hypothetical protein